MGGHDMRQLMVGASHRGHVRMRGLAGTASTGAASQAGMSCASPQYVQAIAKAYALVWTACTASTGTTLTGTASSAPARSTCMPL